MNAKALIAAFVRNPAELTGPSAHTGVPSLSIRKEQSGWALYSYETCIARHWVGDPSLAGYRVDPERPRPGLVHFFWVTSYRYTATTNKFLNRLDVELSQLGEARILRFHVDPCDMMAAESYLLKVADGERKAETGYAPGFGPARGKGKVQTEYGKLHRPHAVKPPRVLVNRKGEM